MASDLRPTLVLAAVLDYVRTLNDVDLGRVADEARRELQARADRRRPNEPDEDVPDDPDEGVRQAMDEARYGE